MIKQIAFALFILIIALNGFAQIKITGTVLNKINIAIEDASVVLMEKNKTLIAAFAITDNKGFFEINYTGNADTVTIKVSVVGYEIKQQTVANKTQILKFVLAEQPTVLPTVLVKEKPITENGDTTNYNVQAFTGKQDRVIGDVIAKLPGVEMDETTGQIKFNGKPISHYYIDGLDLLDKKYNIANKNIPANMVDQVQLLANHQDIKLFDSLKTATDPALNIKLKKNAKNKLIGVAKVGLGITPILWDNEIAAMQFKKYLQLITTYKNNNDGSLLASELAENVGIYRVGENQEGNSKEEIVNKLTLQTPTLSTKRYLFNNTNLLYFNSLKVFLNKAQLKLHVSYLNDNNTNTTALQTNYILPSGQQIYFAEQKANFINANIVEAQVNYTLNTAKKYFKNTVKAKLDFTKENSTIINPSIVSLQLQNPFFAYSNDFILHTAIKKKIVTINSKINYNKLPQRLDVEPGQFAAVFNQTLAYQRLTQNAVQNNFNTDNSIAFFSKLGKLNQQIKMGIAYVSKNLQTSLNKTFNQTMYQLNDTFKNNILWNNVRLYAENNTTIKKGKKLLDISLPIELNLLKSNNFIKNYAINSNKLFFNPSVSLSFPIAENLIGDVSYYLQNTSGGNIEQITSGYILTNYRSINKNDSLLPIQQEQSAYASLYYKNSMRAMFSNLSANYSITKKNMIYNQIFDGLFMQTIGSYVNNYSKSFMLNGSTNKYFIQSKINMALSYSYNNIKADLLQQNKMAKSKSKIISLGLKVNLNMLSYASFETQTKYDNFTNEIKLPSTNKNLLNTSRFQQFVKLYFYTSAMSSLYFINELYIVWSNKNNNGNYYFGDVGFKQKFKKNELQIEWNNVANNKQYITINNTQNLNQINTYNIRPSNIMVKFYFNF